MLAITQLALLGSLVLSKTFTPDCFVETDMLGFDVKRRGDPVEVTDAKMLYSEGLMREDTRPWAIRGCFDESTLVALQIGVESKSALRREWLNVIGD